jgi:hypothetical protein
MSVNLEKKFDYFLNQYLRGKRYHNILPQNIGIYLMQQVKTGLTKENIFQFITWIENESMKTGIDGWKILFEESGEILTDFGYVSFDACDIQKNIIIRIRQYASN